MKNTLFLILFLPLFLVFATPQAHAQYQHRNWWSVSYSFLQMKMSEGNAVESGHFPMLNGEAGVAFTPKYGMSVAASYGGDSLNFSGTDLLGAGVNQILPATLLQVRADGIYMMQSFFFNIGYGYRSFNDSITGSYARTIRTDFVPIGITYYTSPFYFHAEYRRYISGSEELQSMTGGRSDVTMGVGGGGCYALEAGLLLQQRIGVKINLQYAVWNFDTSDSANDGVESVYEPSSQTTEISLGVGLIF